MLILKSPIYKISLFDRYKTLIYNGSNLTGSLNLTNEETLWFNSPRTNAHKLLRGG